MRDGFCFELRTHGMAAVGQPEVRLWAAPGRLEDAGWLLQRIVGAAISTNQPLEPGDFEIDEIRYELFECEGGLLELRVSGREPEWSDRGDRSDPW